MKPVRLILGIAAAVWTLLVAIEFVGKLGEIGSSTRGVTELVAGISAVLICGLIAYWLLAGAFKRPDEKD